MMENNNEKQLASAKVLSVINNNFLWTFCDSIKIEAEQKLPCFGWDNTKGTPSAQSQCSVSEALSTIIWKECHLFPPSSPTPVLTNIFYSESQ